MFGDDSAVNLNENKDTTYNDNDNSSSTPSRNESNANLNININNSNKNRNKIEHVTSPNRGSAPEFHIKNIKYGMSKFAIDNIDI